MTTRTLTLTCEICRRQFEARARRKLVHCKRCAGELRRKGQGPVQTSRMAPAGSLCKDLPTNQICWEEAENDLTYYLERFSRFPEYDGVTPCDTHRITDEDRRLANRIAARMSVTTWAPVVGRPLAESYDWHLLDMSDLEWQRRSGAVHEVLAGLLIHPGIGVARLTKALHRKRPDLIPICDSVVLRALGVRPTGRADVIVACMDRFRRVGLERRSTLQMLRRLSKQLQAEMTELRILELLHWVQFGPFPRVSSRD